METLLVVAIILTTLAVVVQAGVLIAMYVMSRRVVDNVNGLISESQKLMAPLETVTANFKAASEDVAGIGREAREELQRVNTILQETQLAVRDEISDIRLRVNDTFDEVNHTIMTPVREWSAIATGVSTGIRTFFSGRRARSTVPAIVERHDLRKNPAA